MQTYRLRHRDHTTLFEGDYRSIRECLEDALKQGAFLHGISLRNADLSEINLDGAYICNGDFTGTNLTGANVSESRLHDCLFDNAALYNTCFAQSNLSGSHFHDAGFGGTDICGATLDSCVFSGLATLGLGFISCDSMQNAWYETAEQSCMMSRPPLVISGTEALIAIFDQHITIGPIAFTMKGPALARLPRQIYHTVAMLQQLREPVCGAARVENTKSTES